ncbi:MAG: OmpA family protein [Rahnella inusitata]|jgi:outer membrane protein OmpA-like peptidoglycan-associated protein
MSPLRRRVLWLWAGLLAGMLCLVFLPLSPAARWLAFLLTIIICVIGLWRAGRQPDAELTDTLSADLPAENYRLPVVLVCGDDLASLFGDNAVQQTAQGCWVRVDDSGSLRQLVRQILWQRPEWINQLAMMQVVNPQQHGDERALTSALHELRWQMVQLRRDTRRAIPLVLISTVATSLTQSPVWLSQQKSQSVTLWSTLTMPETLANWQRQEGPSEQAQRLKQTALFNEHSDWLKAQVMPVLQESNEDVAPVFVQQVILHQVSKMNHVVPGSLWQRWLADRTALTQVAGWHPQADGGHLHFPEFIFPDLPSGSGVTSRRRMLRHAVTLLTLGAVIALCCSAWHNRQLLHRVAFDIRHYESIGMQDYTAKAKAVEILRQDAAQLNDWFRNGEPLRLGLGLYQGERLRLPLMAAIKNYVPPPPPPPVEKKTPKTVRLDALSLFDTGKYQLKPNSTKLLVNALIDIKAKPGWLIVVAGHTDITGDARANQILSEKRAEALRDWMLSTSDVSPTCFAVQGYGATRPIATNDTPEGRAANRRVEISLVPQANACQAAAIPHSSND